MHAIIQFARGLVNLFIHMHCTRHSHVVRPIHIVVLLVVVFILFLFFVLFPFAKDTHPVEFAIFAYSVIIKRASVCVAKYVGRRRSYIHPVSKQSEQ